MHCRGISFNDLATSAGGYILGITDAFVNNIVLIFSVIVECVVFAWVFKAERLIGFLNSRSHSLKLGKWWLILVKYVIPILLSVIWIGGLYEVISNGTWESLEILIILSAILLISSLILTVLKPKSENWFKADERIK